eukprot:500092-Pelagomonas_calceolata.AAC.5
MESIPPAVSTLQITTYDLLPYIAGNATDYALQLAAHHRAAFLVSPCCVGVSLSAYCVAFLLLHPCTHVLLCLLHASNFGALARRLKIPEPTGYPRPKRQPTDPLPNAGKLKYSLQGGSSFSFVHKKWGMTGKPVGMISGVENGGNPAYTPASPLHLQPSQQQQQPSLYLQVEQQLSDLSTHQQQQQPQHKGQRHLQEPLPCAHHLKMHPSGKSPKKQQQQQPCTRHLEEHPPCESSTLQQQEEHIEGCAHDPCSQHSQLRAPRAGAQQKDSGVGTSAGDPSPQTDTDAINGDLGGTGAAGKDESHKASPMGPFGITLQHPR